MKYSINRSVFNHIISSPNYIRNKDLTLIYSLCNKSCLGFILPRRLGCASDRNLLRRQCRGAFSVFCKNNPMAPLGVIVRPQKVNINYNQISNVFTKLSSRLVEN